MYATAYRGAFMVIFNRLADALADRWPSFKLPLAPALFPVFLASLDYFEDALQASQYVGQQTISIKTWYQADMACVGSLLEALVFELCQCQTTTLPHPSAPSRPTSMP